MPNLFQENHYLRASLFVCLSLCWCIPFSLRAKVKSNKFLMDIRTQGYTLGHKKIGAEKADIGKWEDIGERCTSWE